MSTIVALMAGRFYVPFQVASEHYVVLHDYFSALTAYLKTRSS